MKKICIITTNRADFGFMYWLIEALHIDSEFELQLVVSGSHLSKRYGLTINEIQKSKFPISDELNYIIEGNENRLGDQLALFTTLLTQSLQRLSPDLIFILGDRYELLSVASVALTLDIPLAHLSGGEITEGALDESVRHAVTKLSYWHFVANEVFRKRVIQMGESPNRVFCVGELGLEHLRKTKIVSRNVLVQGMWSDTAKPFFVITYHPETWSDLNVLEQQNEVLTSLAQFLPSHNLLITYPNCDKDSQALINELHTFQETHSKNVFLSSSLGVQKYISALTYADLVIGNSSSGILEAPSYKCITINIGDRQKGRISGPSIIHSKCDAIKISQAITESLTLPKESFSWDSLYGDGFVVDKIMSVLKNSSTFPVSSRKAFYNL